MFEILFSLIAENCIMLKFWRLLNWTEIQSLNWTALSESADKPENQIQLLFEIATFYRFTLKNFHCSGANSSCSHELCVIAICKTM